MNRFTEALNDEETNKAFKKEVCELIDRIEIGTGGRLDGKIVIKFDDVLLLTYQLDFFGTFTKDGIEKSLNVSSVVTLKELIETSDPRLIETKLIFKINQWKEREYVKNESGI